MTREVLAALIAAAAVVSLARLGFAVRAVRDVARMTRAVAEHVCQEEEKTRARLDERFARGPR